MIHINFNYNHVCQLMIIIILNSKSIILDPLLVLVNTISNRMWTASPTPALIPYKKYLCIQQFHTLVSLIETRTEKMTLLLYDWLKE